MKIFTNKNLIQKVIIALVCIFLLNFCIAPTQVQAAAEFGGSIFKPMKDFITAVGDIVITLVQWGVTGEWIYAVDDAGAAKYGANVDKDFWLAAEAVVPSSTRSIRYPVIQLSPELIFANEIELLNIDFIGGRDDENYIIESNGNAISKLREIIANWYATLRIIAIVGLLSVLIYIGIRIIISSTSQDRAKYKQRLLDWIVAFCLLFFMHYIMAATVDIVNRVDEALASNIGKAIELDPEHGYIIYNPAEVYPSQNDPDYKLDNIEGAIFDYLKAEGIIPQDAEYGDEADNYFVTRTTQDMRIRGRNYNYGELLLSLWYSF